MKKRGGSGRGSGGVAPAAPPSSAPERESSNKVLVLNAGYQPVNVCSARRAAVLVLKERAVMVEAGEGFLRAENFALERPAVIRLNRYIRVPRERSHRHITRKAVLARDDWTCQYCGKRQGGLTVDHVIPRSRGGASTWDNIVAACAPCNRRKGDRLPREIQMHPLKPPAPPPVDIFIRVAAPAPPPVWSTYLAA